ncbi:GNAT family N-acetyltransferase [Peribacillus alkalitolerans]|uniref:GNAT family N-acetyltransferase n=1 Tax=Peribacillus alkalitolerans TaxID=1550385 RepID=UPI0013D67C63|nr:GNAT family N-acetyltransferase [Peribacillus alkalitolerans]
MKKIMRATVEDATAILSIQKLAYVSEAEIYGNYEIEPLMQTVSDVEKAFDTHLILKYLLNDILVGSVRAYEKDGTCYIGKLMVHPDFQNRGIAKELMKEIESLFEDARFELFTGSESKKNISFYEKIGYKGYKTEKLAREDTVFLFMEKTAPTSTRIR